MTLVFGSSTASLNDYAVGQGNSQQFTDNINHLVLYFVYLFVARFVIGYVATLCICIAATRTTCSLRKAFLESTLRQEVWHFDKQGNGSAATQVTTSTWFSTKQGWLLTRAIRWQPCQSRHCRETIHMRPGNFALFLGIYCGTCCPVEACSHYNDHSASDCPDDRRMHRPRCTRGGPHRK